MSGYFISDVIELLHQQYPDDLALRKLYEYSICKSPWSCKDRQQILNLIAECLTAKSLTFIVAECFSPILLDLFYRISKNNSKLSLFNTVSRLIGSYACATNFAYDFFNDHFITSNFTNEIKKNEENLIDFLESCYVFLNFDSEFFISHFDWTCIMNFFNHQNHYICYLSKKIYSKVLKLDANASKKIITQHEEDIDDYRLRLFDLTNGKFLKFIPKTIEYREVKPETCLILDEDFSVEVISVQGILLPSTFPTKINHTNLWVLPSSFKVHLKSIALGVSLSKPILVEGPMSCGKSTLINQLAYLTGRQNPPDIMTIQISDQVDNKYLLGSYVCSDIPGEFLFNLGPLLKAIRDGNWIVLEDIDSASSELISSIVSIIKSRNTANIAGCEGKIEKFNSNFRIFFTKNIQTSGSMVQNVNFKMLEKMCYTMSLENINSLEVSQLLSKKWPNMNFIIPRILSIYENLINSYSDTKTKHCVWLRDLMKWCNRLSKYFKLNSNVIATQHAFLDAVDCFICFCPNLEFFKQISFMLGSNFNLSKSECQYLLEERIPKITKDSETLTVGRQSVPVSKSSKHLPDFAFTLNTTQLLERLLVCVSNREPVLLCGETGVGKTSCIQYMANLCGRKLNIINMNQQSSSTELFGGYKPIDFKYLISFVKEDYHQLFDETFCFKKNHTFKTKFSQLYQKQDWAILLEVMNHVCQKALNKSKHNKDLFQKWTILHEKLVKFKTLLDSMNQLSFTFIDGVLIHAIKSGQWILLDEINLAENETLQGLLSFMENDQTLMLFEKSYDQIVKVHEGFRLFACMNPATDVGKKELPMKIRSRFTEFFINEEKDRSQLRIIVCTYIQNLVSPQTIESIINFYFQIKLDSQTLLKDINGHRPIFSLRNLCRALRVTKFNPFNSTQRSLYEAFSLAFLSNLDHDSYQIVRKRIEDIIFPNVNLSRLLNMQLHNIFPSSSFVIIENYPIMKGPNSSVIDESYILTSTVTKNLQDICRIISAGRTYPILIQGETSVGKTSLIQWLAKATGNICHRVNNHEHTDLQEYVGSYCSESSGKIIFKKGILVEAMKHGHWIILDELNLAPTEVLEALNRVLDENREIFIPETQEIIKAHPRFLLFATQNPPGRYGGRKILSRAFRNRFIELNFTEIPLTELEIILHKKCTIPLSYSKRMVSVLTQLQKRRCESDIFAGKHGFITLRDLFRWGYRYMKFAKKLDNSIKFYDWNEFLANQGYMLLGGRVRNKEDTILIKDILEKSFKCTISLENLFYGNKSFIQSYSEKFNNIVWTNTFKRLGTLLHEAIEYEEPILLVGETGCGKTTICQYFATINHKNLKIINCHMNTESGDFIGSLRPNRNAVIDQNEALFEWVDGPLVTAMKNGDYFLIDEISLADDSVLERLNSVLELERTIFLAENSDTFLIQAESSFRYFATMNPGGDFGKKELSPALRDRFTEIWCPTFEDFNDIKQIIFHNLQIENEELKFRLSEIICNFIEWFEDFISKYKRFTISIRDILSWTHFINRTLITQQCLNLREAFIHGAYLVFIDPFTNSKIWTRQSSTNNNAEVNKICQNYIVTSSQQLPDDDIVQNSNLTSEKFFSIGPFYIKKGSSDSKNISYYWESCGVKSNCIRIMRALQLDKPILLEGPPGVGKTSLIQALAIASGHSLIRINLSDQTDISDLFGCDLPVEGQGNAGKFLFRDGPFLTALKSDSTWILLDELNLAPQTVLEGLNACLDHRGEIYISELNKTFHVDKCKTRIFASQNPFSLDGTRKGLPKSFLNRFTTVYINDLGEEDFQFILSNLFPSIPVDQILKMVNVNQQICEKVEQVNSFAKKGGPFEFNLRDLIRWAQLTTKWHENYSQITPEIFFNLIYLYKMRTVEDKQIMKDICFEEYKYLKNDEEVMCFINNSISQFGYSLSQRNSTHGFGNQSVNYCFEKHKTIIESIMKCVEMNWLTILIGNSGFGKSHLVKLVANIYGKDLNVLHVNSEMDTIDLLGGFEQKNFNIDLKNLEETIISYSFQLLNLHCDNFKLVEKYLAYFYQLKNSAINHQNMNASLKSKIKILRKILNLFEGDQQNLSFRVKLDNFEMINIHTNNGTFEWRDSSLIKSIQTGGWVLIENANFLNPAVLDRLNSLLEPGGSLTINEKGSINGQITCIYPHKDFRLFLTMNPKYGELSRAMRNRGIEIVLPTNVNSSELKGITTKHGFKLADYQDFADYSSFFKSITESNIKKQHGYDESSLCSYSENKLISMLASPCNLNCLASDPNLYYALQDYFTLKLSVHSFDMTRVRLFFENSQLEDFSIRFKIFNSFTSLPYDCDLIQQFKQELSIIKNDLSLLFEENIFDFIKMLPIDCRENRYLCEYIQNKVSSETFDKWYKKLNHFHLDLFWLDLKQRLSLIENENSLLSIDSKISKLKNSSFLVSTRKFLINMFEKLNYLIVNSLPNDEELMRTRHALIISFQFLSTCAKPNAENWEKFMKEDFFSIWFLLNEKDFFNILPNDSFKLLISEINVSLNMNSHFFDKQKCNFVQKMCSNYFIFKSHEDISIFLKYKQFLKLLKNIGLNYYGKDLQKFNTFASESVALLMKYFCRKDNFTDIDGELLTKNLDLKEIVFDKNSRSPDKQLSKCFILSKLLSSLQLLDLYMNRSSVIDELAMNNQLFIDPYLIFFNHLLKNGKHTDLFLEILLNINEEFNMSSIIKCLADGQNIHLNDKLIQNITCEFLPLISIIYFDIFNNEHDSIEIFYKKQLTQNFYSNVLKTNYYRLKNSHHKFLDRFVSLAKMFHGYIKEHNYSKIDLLMQNESIELLNINKKLSQCFDLILIGYNIASSTTPDYPIDPMVRTKTKLDLYNFHSNILEEELNLRHVLYRKMYGYHNDEFNCNLFQKLKENWNNLKKKVSHLKKLIVFRKSPSDYFNLTNEISQFQKTIFDWDHLKKILIEFKYSSENLEKSQIESKHIITKYITYFQSINDFLKHLHQAYVDYQDIATPFKIGLFFVLKGIQLLICHLQSSSNTYELFHSFDTAVIQQLFDMFSQFVNVFSPFEICQFIFKNDIILILLKTFKHLNLDQKLLIKNLLESIFLENENSIYLGDNCPEILWMYFKTIDVFVQEWQKKELNQDCENMKKSALFHIRLQNDDKNHDDDQSVEEIFPSFEKHYYDLIDSEYDFYKQRDSKNNNDIKVDVSKDTLLFIARSHIDMISLLENPRNENLQMNFLKSYLARYQIISSIFQRTFGFIQIDIEQNLIDGHLLANKYQYWHQNKDKIFNIYHSSLVSQTQKCCTVLENLRTKITNKLLPEFENHPILIKLLQIIQRIYEIKADSSLLCIATGLELILKTGEDWQLIAHRGISLVDHLNEIAELLVSWRKMEINFWLKCLDTVSNKIEEKELLVWWFRFYTAINDLIKEQNGEQIKLFIKYVKKFMENSTLGQFSIRLKIINVIIYYLKYSKSEIDPILTALENVYNFYNHFLSPILKNICSEKNLIEKEIQEFVTISKWNPNNFWSLKASLTKSKKQLYGYVKKYEQYLSKPSLTLFQFEKKLSLNSWRMCIPIKTDSMIVPKLEFGNLLSNFNIEKCEFVLKADFYIKKTENFSRKIRNSSRSYVGKINDLEEFNNMLINSINDYSNLNATETENKETRKKQISQIQNQKRRALSNLFKKLSLLGLSFKKGVVNFENFDLNETIFSIKSLNNENQFEATCMENIRSCNTYYYKCLYGYSNFVSSLEKRHSQLTIDMIDRIKGYVVHLTEMVITQRAIISRRLNEFNELNIRYSQIKNSIDQKDHTIFDYERVKENVRKFRELIFKFLSFTIRLKINISSFNNENNDNFDCIIESVKHILVYFQLNKFVFYTESSLKKFNTSATELKIQIQNLSILLNNDPEFFELNVDKLNLFQNQINEILDEIDLHLNESINQHSKMSLDFDMNSATKCNILLRNILLCFEKIFKNLIKSREKPDEDQNDVEQNLIQESSFIRILNLFNSYTIIPLVNDFFTHINEHSKDKFSESYIKMINIFLPFYSRYIDLFKCSLSVSFGSLKTSSKLLHILLTLSNELLTNGFCLPPEFNDDSHQNEQQKTIENAGFGDGNIISDAKDVSDRLDCQDQLDDLDQGDGDSNQLNNGSQEKDEQNGINMDDDFDGREYGANKTESNQQQQDDESSSEDDLVDQMGDVDDDEQVLDEKFWNNELDDSEDEAKDLGKESQLTGGQEDLDNRTVANKDNEKLNSGNNANDTNENEEICSIDSDDNLYQPESIDDNKIDEDFNENNNENESSNHDDKEMISEMILPEEMQLDELDNGDESENMEILEDQENVDVENSNASDDGIVDQNEDIDQALKMNDTAKEEKDEITHDNMLSNRTKNSNNNKLNTDSYSNIENPGQSNQDSLVQEDDSIIGSSQQQISQSLSDQHDKITTALTDLESTNKEQTEYSMSRDKKNRSFAEDESSKAKRRKITNINEIKDEQQVAKQTDLFRHVEDKSKANDLAYDIAPLKDQENFEELIERGVNINENNESMEQFGEENDKFINNNNVNIEIDKIENSEKNEKDDIQEKHIQGDFVITLNVHNKSSFHTKNNNNDTDHFVLDSKVEDSKSFSQIDDTNLNVESFSNLDNQLWIESEKRIEPLLYELCNQLQLVLKQTKCAKYKGDFKNGKRLNMRKVIAYIASQFRKDKIWLRRTKPNKRQYQILIAVDDSLSMSDNQSRMIAFDSLILLGKSLSIIESGLLSIVSFGEQVRVLHPFGNPFTDQSAIKMFSKFQFNQKRTKINELLKCSLTMFADAKQHINASSNSNIHQLLLIVSDGRGIFSEGDQNIRLSIMKLKEMQIFSVFIIIDNPEHKNSIMDIQIPIFNNSGGMTIESYIEKFPFPYYVILKDLNSLPLILGNALRQWFELIAYENK